MYEKKCVWKFKLNYWTTECGFGLTDDSTSKSWKWCPWCGKPIEDYKEPKDVKRGDE